MITPANSVELGHFERLESYLPVHLLSLHGFILAMLVMSVFIIGRYFLFVFPFYWLFWKQHERRRGWYFVHTQSLRPGQIRLEIVHSMISSLIFALAGYAIGLEWQLQQTKIYLIFSRYGYWYLPVSFLLITSIHEIYFYFTHRWMHRPWFYRRVHSLHHFSRNTSPWASFSFHPGEAVIQAVFLPILVLVLPVHPVVLIIYLTFMTLTAISNHLGVELFSKSPILAWFISGHHHALHHQNFNCNYGLYYRFLDQIFGTENQSLPSQNSVEKPMGVEVL